MSLQFLDKSHSSYSNFITGFVPRQGGYCFKICKAEISPFQVDPPPRKGGSGKSRELICVIHYTSRPVVSFYGNFLHTMETYIGFLQ